MVRFLVCALLAVPALSSAASAQSCTGSPAAVQILGSGGPRINPQRASASYLLWVDGRAKMLVDMGGGTSHRFGESRANLEDVALMAVSHLHPDHVSDLPALMWLSHQMRKAPLPIVGPSGNEIAPDFPTFLNRLFDAKTGAYQVLGHTVGAKEGNGVPLEITTVDVKKGAPTTVFDGDGLMVTAVGIPHANMPALAYRATTRGVTVVFSTDQNGTDPKFVDFARGADILVMHMAIAAGTTSPLHAAPAVVGRIAQDAGVKRLVLSHIGLFDLDAAVADVKKAYTGPLVVGADLQCTDAR
jgi:ribonuclease BN (tRNA processing enzyme)